jgi:hypothetical protein
MVAALGDAGLLADAIPEVLPGVLKSAASAPRRLTWTSIVDEMRELWPIHYLLPGGAGLTLRPGTSAPPGTVPD